MSMVLEHGIEDGREIFIWISNIVLVPGLPYQLKAENFELQFATGSCAM